MAQSVWTVFSAASILAKFYKMGIDAHITAAGDNQVVLVKKTPLLAGRRLQRVIETSAKDTGHETKPEELFTSRCVTEFNKQTFVHDKKASQGTKKAARIGGDSDEIIPSINSRLVSVNSTGVAAAGESESPRGAFTVSLFETLHVIKERSLKCTELSMLLCSRALGGLKVNLYPSFCVRGILDMQTMNAAMWLFASSHKLTYSYHLKAIKRIKLRFGKINPESLLLDPYHLPLVGPRDDVESKLKGEIEEKLITITKNKIAKELLSNRTASESKHLSQDIFSMKPYQPKVAAALYQGANCALKDRLTGRFTNASSVIQLVRDDKDLASHHCMRRQSNKIYTT